MAQERIPLLQSVRVASPCSASWEGMERVDGERVKFCDSCRKRVYNLSAMGQAEAEGLLRTHEGRLCVRYYERTDGTILTDDCPLGRRMVRAARRAVARRVAVAAVLFPFLYKAAAMIYQEQPAMGGSPPPISRDIMGSPAPAPAPPVQEETRPLLGDVAPASVRMGRAAVRSPRRDVFKLDWKVPPKNKAEKQKKGD